MMLSERNFFTSKHSPFADRSLGPRDIGVSKGYKPYKSNLSDYNDYSRGINAPRLSKAQTNISFTERKLGPRDIGRSKGWKRAKYQIPQELEKSKTVYDLPALYYSRSKTNVPTSSGLFRERKLGPREIGRVKDWKPAKYTIDVDYDKRINKPRIPKAKPIIYAPERKLGPRDYGKPEGWSPPPKEWAKSLAFNPWNRKSSGRPKRQKNKRSHSVQITSNTMEQLDFSNKISKKDAKRSKSVQLNVETIEQISYEKEQEIQRMKPMPRKQLAGLFSSEEDLLSPSVMNFEDEDEEVHTTERTGVAFKETPEVFSPPSEFNEDYQDYNEPSYDDEENVDEKTLMTTEEF